MPVEFALRPRIRLREDPTPARRARPRLPKFALPALAYWLVIGGLVFEFVRRHDVSAPPAEAEAALAPLTPPSPPAVRQWWRPLPAPTAPSAPLPVAEPSAPEAVEAVPPELSESEPQPRLAEPGPGFAEPAAAVAEDPLLSPIPTLGPTHAPKAASRFAPGLAPAPAPSLASAPANVPTLSLPAPEPARAPAPAPAPASTPTVASFLPSCEAALAAASQDVDFSGGNRAADLPTQAIAAVLENGAWLGSCARPDHTTLDVCVAIKGGRVVGASVTSRPADSALNSCVKRRASSLQFPYSPHVDLARTRF